MNEYDKRKKIVLEADNLTPTDFIMPEETPQAYRDTQMTDAILAFAGRRCAGIAIALAVAIGIIFTALYFGIFNYH
jgi:hypothetical protein